MTSRSSHVCKKFFTHRGHRRCEFCGKQEWKVARKGTEEGKMQYTWERDMSLKHFADRWLPTVSGTKPVDLMRVDVAFPFEWNCYESWNVVWRVTFDFSRVHKEGPASTTRTMTLDGWTSQYQECFNRISAEVEDYYASQTGASYRIGDNTYDAMRRIIQA